jgi:hypothetical protein
MNLQSVISQSGWALPSLVWDYKQQCPKSEKKTKREEELGAGHAVALENPN